MKKKLVISIKYNNKTPQSESEVARKTRRFPQKKIMSF